LKNWGKFFKDFQDRVATMTKDTCIVDHQLTVKMSAVVVTSVQALETTMAAESNSAARAAVHHILTVVHAERNARTRPASEAEHKHVSSLTVWLCRLHLTK